MTLILMIVSILLISIVLLQSGKAESASAAISGGADLFANRKERGGELFISRLTYSLGTIFFIICFIMGF